MCTNRKQEVDSASPGSSSNHSRSPAEEEQKRRMREKKTSRSSPGGGFPHKFLTDTCSLFSCSWTNGSVWCSGVAFRNTSSTAPSSCTDTAEEEEEADKDVEEEEEEEEEPETASLISSHIISHVSHVIDCERPAGQQR